MIESYNDESDHENPTRLVIVPRSNRVDLVEVMNHLFATTDLERNYRVNLNIIGLDGRPRVMGLKEILGDWLEFRTTTVTRRLQHRLQKVVQRLHILDGLLIAFLNLDEVIRIIRREDEPKPLLMKRFKLSDERDELEALLKSKAKLKKLIAAEIRADADKYGDERRTKIIEREAAQAIDETTLIPNEPVTVVLSTGGWVRSAKGHDIEPGALSYKSGDAFQALARGHGEPLSGRLDPPDGAKFAGVMIGEPEDLWLLATDAGYGFTARLKDLVSDRRAGKTVLNVPQNALVLAPAPVPSPDSLVAVVSSEGKLLAFPVGEVPEMPRGKGNKLYDIAGKKAAARAELMTAVAVVPPKASLVLWSGEQQKVLEWRDLQDYVGERAQRGAVLKRGWPRQIDRLETRLPPP